MIDKLAENTDLPDLTAVAELFTQLTNLIAKSVPEVFEYPGPTKTPQFVRGLIEQPGNAIFVARREDQVVGALHALVKAAVEQPGRRQRRYGYIERIYVAGDLRGGGIGQRLVKAAEVWARRQDLEWMELNSWHVTQDAVNFFAKLGYLPKNINFWRHI